MPADALATTGRAPVPESAAEARAALCRCWAEAQAVSDYLRSTDWLAFERAQPVLSELFRGLIHVDRELARLE